jgi:phosphotransferase system enzyme I (PtsI)
LATEVDFVSIGTNDLAQYTLATDRLNDKVAHLFDHYHPALLRLLNLICETARQHHLPLSVCGEMASDHSATPFWLALGVQELSMSASHLLTVKETVLQSNAYACKMKLPSLLASATAAEAIHILKTMNNEEE